MDSILMWFCRERAVVKNRTQKKRKYIRLISNMIQSGEKETIAENPEIILNVVITLFHFFLLQSRPILSYLMQYQTSFNSSLCSSENRIGSNNVIYFQIKKNILISDATVKPAKKKRYEKILICCFIDAYSCKYIPQGKENIVFFC